MSVRKAINKIRTPITLAEKELLRQAAVELGYGYCDEDIEQWREGLVESLTKLESVGLLNTEPATDLEKMESFFAGLGIKYVIEKWQEHVRESYCTPTLIYNACLTICNGEDKGDGIGYPQFRADFYFLDEVFVGWGSWE